LELPLVCSDLLFLLIEILGIRSLSLAFLVALLDFLKALDLRTRHIIIDKLRLFLAVSVGDHCFDFANNVGVFLI